MFRTRDFILVFTAVVFLLLAIGSTLIIKNTDDVILIEAIQLADVVAVEYGAEVYTEETPSRADRIAEMKLKVAESSSLSISSPEIVLDTVDEEDGVLALETDVPKEVQQCTGYSVYKESWPTGVKLDLVEGARVVYVESLRKVPVVLSSSSTASDATLLSDVERDILVQLPVRSFKSPEKTCLNTDVVGIAKDGSLIRNNEAGLYGIFDSETIVGYALDGFTIYGKTNLQTDVCGGHVVEGKYRYSISTDSEEIINCFASAPAKI